MSGQASAKKGLNAVADKAKRFTMDRINTWTNSVLIY